MLQFYLTKTANGIICLDFNWDDKDATFNIEGFKQTGAFKELNGNLQTKMERNRLSVPVKGVHSMLLQFQGKETFEQLRKQLKLIVQR